MYFELEVNFFYLFKKLFKSTIIYKNFIFWKMFTNNPNNRINKKNSNIKNSKNTTFF